MSMTRDALRSAVDAAARDQLSRMFGVLVEGMIDGKQDEAARAFGRGVAMTIRAHDVAVAAVESEVS